MICYNNGCSEDVREEKPINAGLSVVTPLFALAGRKQVSCHLKIWLNFKNTHDLKTTLREWVESIM